VECVLGVPFGYGFNEEVRRLLEDFRDMVNFAYRRGITSYARLGKGVYGGWKGRWDYSTHFCHSACKIALSMLKTYREGRPEAKRLFMQLDPMLYRFYGDRNADA